MNTYIIKNIKALPKSFDTTNIITWIPAIMAEITIWPNFVDLASIPAIKNTNIILTNSDGWKEKLFPNLIARLAPLSFLPNTRTDNNNAMPTKQYIHVRDFHISYLLIRYGTISDANDTMATIMNCFILF